MFGVIFVVLAATHPEANIVQARQALARARSSSTELKVSEAIRYFEQAATAFQSAHPALPDRREVQECWIEIAAMWLSQRKEDRADQALRRAIAFAPDLGPNPKLYPPDVIERFARVKRELQRKASATLTVTTQPAGATIWLDGVNVGRSPRSLAGLIEGEHWLSLEAPGHESMSTSVTLTSGKIDRADVVLNQSGVTPAASAPVVIVSPAVEVASAPVSSLPTVKRETPVYERAWFWVVVSSVVAGGVAAGIGGYYATRPASLALVFDAGGRR